ncbi:MAG: signal transduction histidine kinase/DNA-binding response OmpR family regulator [Halioglobus sp.]|jgi:signal transduction histidine kinase/DNA-binding response OmpR family regulator/ligand-binding sensor domain-containing protein
MTQVQCFGLEEGLSDYNIKEIFQDSRGVIWIATQYGLNRYDGSSIKVYTKEDLGLPSDWIVDIEEDANQMLWIRSNQLSYLRSTRIFDPITEKSMSIAEYTGSPFNSELLNRPMSPLYNGSNMFVQKEDAAFNYYELKGNQLRFAFKIRSDAINFQHRSFLYAYKLSQDTFLIGAADDKSIYVNSKGEILRIANPAEKFSKSIDLAFNGKIDGLKGTEQIISKNNIKYSFYEDTLNIYSNSGKLLEKKNLDVKSNKTSSHKRIMFDDHHGNIWINSQQRSFCILSLKEQKFKVEAFDESSASLFRGILKTDDGTICAIGGSNELRQAFLYQKPSEGTSFMTNGSFGFGILEADSSNLWIGNYGYLTHYNLKNQDFRYYRSNTTFWQPYKSPDRNIWCGASNGLLKLDSLTKQLNHFRDYSNFPILEKSTVYAFHTNEQGTWLSTSAGLFLVDLKQEIILEYYSKNQEGAFYIPTDHIAHFHEDQAGIFWLATKGDGLIRWDPKTKNSEVFSKANTSLSHDVLYGIYEDDFNNLWISSYRGLMSFNKTSHLVTTYREEDGIPHNEFNTISHHQDKEGNMYFGTQNGFVHFHPRDFIPEKTDYPFIMSACAKELLENDSIIKLTAQLLESHEINFYPSDKSINLDFALLDYQNLSGIQYSYKIEGYHQDWIYQKASSLHIFGLPYGDYKLFLRAKSPGSYDWIEYPEVISIKVKKPFYLEWWFIVASILALGLLVIYIVRRRTQKLIVQKKELEQLVVNRTAKIEEQNEELRSLDKVKSNFFANISHELRTPLTLILGPLSYILDKPDAWQKEDVQKQLLVMQRNGKSLLELIEEILDLSKLEANKMELEEEATSIREFFEHIFSVFEPQFQSLGVDYDLNFELQNPDQFVLLDRKKMEKILNNFLSNAIKFTPKGNRITLLISETEDQLNIKVSDTGKGVHPNDLPFIFERFYQSKQEDQKLYGGTGIGLALVNEFAELMGGKAYAESTLGVGSQFYFELPLKPVSVENFVSKSAITIVNSEFEEEPIDSIGTDFTILVVEDNEDMRNFVCQLLESKYKKILQAKNGAEGLEQLEKHGLEIRLVISDVMMPEVDGLTMLKVIKSNKEWSGIPVVMLTALAAERDKLAALTIGVDDYLTKPFSVTELMARVQNLLYNYHQREEWQKSLEYLEGEDFDKTDVDVPETSDQDKKWVLEIESLIKESIASGVPSAESLCISFNLSSRQFHRKLKEITGLTPGKFIREVQLQMSRKELENGASLSVKEVAFNNGFELSSTFSKLFKTRFGKSPSEYLKNRGVADLS